MSGAVPALQNAPCAEYEGPAEAGKATKQRSSAKDPANEKLFIYPTFDGRANAGNQRKHIPHRFSGALFFFGIVITRVSGMVPDRKVSRRLRE